MLPREEPRLQGAAMTLPSPEGCRGAQGASCLGAQHTPGGVLTSGQPLPPGQAAFESSSACALLPDPPHQTQTRPFLRVNISWSKTGARGEEGR